MRITGSELRKIIREEVARHFVNEQGEEKEFDFADKPEVIKKSEVPAGVADLAKKKQELMAKLKARGIDLAAAEAAVAAVLSDDSEK